MTKNSTTFHGRLLVITGGGSGIGHETALAFARRGAEVVLSDVNLDAARQTAKMIEMAGGTAHAYQLDVADEAAVHAHADQVAEKHGVPDILINNAGIGQAGAFLTTPSTSFTRTMNVNFYGVVNGCRAFAAKMVERDSGGHIVNLASMAAYSPQQSFSAYSTKQGRGVHVFRLPTRRVGQIGDRRKHHLSRDRAHQHRGEHRIRRCERASRSR
jgi:NAD(P)-dependent dehydrogenase (short-subunit alcohol dehydrogenase family)